MLKKVKDFEKRLFFFRFLKKIYFYFALRTGWDLWICDEIFDKYIQLYFFENL